ncbi:MAG TPA: PAS domain S-box protein, partial [Thermoplasmatales archaeon]|nr:PAS domain S-box protein [Thermoplasmatales archaeon]
MAKFNEIDSMEKLYRFTAKSIRNIAGKAIVVVSSYEPRSKTIVVQSVEGLGKNLSTLLNLLGKNVVGMEFPVHKDKYAQYGKELVKLSDGIYDLSSGRISKRVADTIQKLLGIGDIYTMDIIRGEKLFGNITIIMRKGEKLKNKQLIETFIGEAGIAYQRLLILQQLRESEKRYRQLYENAGVPIFTYDENLNVTDVNETACIMAGIKKEDVIGKNIFEVNILHPGDIKKAMEHIEKLFTGKEDISVEKLRLRRADGTYGIFEVYATIREFIGNKEIIDVCHDVTEKEKLMDELSESERRFRGLVENAHDAIYILSPRGFEYVNPAFEKLTGYSKEELLSKDFSFWALIHPDDIEKIKEREKARRRRRKIPSRYEFRIITKNGETRVVEASTMDVGRGSYRVIGMLRDVTERIKAQEEISKLSNLHYSIGMGINRNDTVEGLCRDLLASIKDVLEIDYGSIFIYSRDKKALIPVAHLGYPK